MKEYNIDYDSVGISKYSDAHVTYKPHVFSMNYDDIKDIRNLVIQMSHLPLHREINDSK